MNIKITVLRQEATERTAYLQSFSYVGDGKETVADWLYDTNRSEAAAHPIAWECSCLEKKCGACAMRINGRPVLACSVFLKDAERDGTILLEPLRKFPVIADLIVDRSSIFHALKDMHVWLSEISWTAYAWDRDLQYKAGQCLLCGCCLEVCPNFLPGRPFMGASAMAAAYKAMEQNIADGHKQAVIQAYVQHVYKGCSQSFSCQTVCPMNLPLDRIQARINRIIR